MDKIDKYRAIIKAAMQQYDRHEQPDGYQEFETQLVVDDANGHYYLMDVGWNNMQRIHGCVLHIDLRKDKVWIQQDWTDSGIADDLIAAGVSKEDIVLAFHAPYKRQHTGFAVA
jgi:XisI protein